MLSHEGPSIPALSTDLDVSLCMRISHLALWFLMAPISTPQQPTPMINPAFAKHLELFYLRNLKSFSLIIDCFSCTYFSFKNVDTPKWLKTSSCSQRITVGLSFSLIPTSSRIGEERTIGDLQWRHQNENPLCGEIVIDSSLGRPGSCLPLSSLALPHFWPEARKGMVQVHAVQGPEGCK